MASPTPEQYSRVSYLYDSLTPKPTELLNRGRYYIREGPLLVWDENRRKKSKRYIFLLNDALLIVKRDGRTKFFLRVFINLRSQHIGVEDMSSGFDHAFRLSVKNRSFVFFSDSDVQSWISDVERSVRGKLEDNGDSQKGDSFGSGLSRGGNTKPSKSAKSAKSGQLDFNSFTDGDFVETKVTFDSGMKLGGIRSTGGDDGAPIPILAPPPARRNSMGVGSPVTSPAAARTPTAATTAAPVATGGVPSLVDFLALSAAPPAANTTGVAKPAVTPATNSNLMDLWNMPAPATTQPAAPPSPFGPFGTAAPAQNTFGTAPAPNASAGLQAAYYGQSTQNTTPAFNPFLTPATQPAQPYGTNGAYNTGYGAQPAYGAQASPFAPAPAANNDPFAMFTPSSASQPAKTAKPVDFF